MPRLNISVTISFLSKNDDTIVRGEGKGQRVMIGIIIEVNEVNRGKITLDSPYDNFYYSAIISLTPSPLLR